MTFLDRPVFDWQIQFTAPSESVNYDCKPLTIGFGTAEFAPTARQVQRGWEVKFWLKTAAEIAAYDTWSAALKGRLNGCWFPEPEFVLGVISSPAPGTMNVAECGMVDVWNRDARLHLFIVAPDGTKTAATVLDVTAPAPGIERVVISEAISPAPGWRVSRLLYVRQAEDDETATLIAEHWQERSISVLELPEEYQAAEVGDEPMYSYHFYEDIPGEDRRSWYYTSFAEGFFAGGNNYDPLAITHDGFTSSVDADEEEITIHTVLRSGTPWASMVIDAPERPLWVIVSRHSYGAPETVTRVFCGTLKAGAEFTGRKVTLKFSSWLDGDGRVPSETFGANCTNELFDVRTCKADRSAHALAVTFNAIASNVVVVAGSGLVAQPANRFARGILDMGSGATREIRSILASTVVSGGETQLTLSRPIKIAVVGNAATITPGCRGTKEDCHDIFDNLANCSGCAFMPRDNPSLKGPAIEGGGAKK